MESTLPGCSRVHQLSAELCERGLPFAAARALCSKLVVQPPFVERVGIAGLIEQLSGEGLDRRTAEDVTLLLWGLERLAQGALYGELLAGIHDAGFEEAASRTAALDAARLHRRLGRRPRVARGRSFAQLWPPLLFALVASATILGAAL